MMRSAAVLGGFAAVALALLVLLVWFQRTQDGGGSDSRPMNHAQTSAATLQEPATDTEAGHGSSTRPVESAQRDALETAAAPMPTCLVRVVEAASGTPLPDARLWIQRDDVDRNGPEWWRAIRRSNDVESVLATGFGREVMLDARGEVRVPRPARGLSVAAALGTLHGDAFLEPRAEMCIVELKPYHALTVEVIDRVGKPVPGALVVLFWGEFDPLKDSNLLQADEEGRLVIAKLEDQLYEHTDRGPVRVTLAGGVSCEPELVEFRLDSVPSEPVRFVAGDFASVVVQLTDPQGRELALEGNVYLDIDTYSVERPSLALLAGARSYLPLQEGRAVFPCIGLGLPLEIGCVAKGHDGEWRLVPGPSMSRQELQVLMSVGERMAIARGRVSGMVIDGWISGKARSSSTGFTARIDQHGTFEAFFQNGELERLAAPWKLKFEHGDSSTLGAIVVPRVDIEQMMLDFGEIVLEPLGALVRLRVVDGDGAPIRAIIEIQSSSGSDMRGCDEAGAVRIDGRAEELPLRVRAEHRAWLASEWLEVAAPATEATLTLRRGAALEGRVLLPSGANLQSCGLELNVVLADMAREPEEYETSPVEGGRFRFETCEPGHAQLTVTYDGLPIVERRGIELVAGATTQLPEIDLRTSLHPFTLTLALASGAPWLGGHLEVLEPDGETSTWVMIGPSARAFLLFPRPELDLWVAGRGARATLFEGVLDGDRLALPAAPSVVLRLAREIPLPEPPLALVVRGMRTKPEEVAFEPDDDVDGADAVVGADGLVRLSVPWPGEYELAWCVRHAGTGAEFDVEPAELQTVAIDDSTFAAVVDVRLTPAEGAQAVLAAGGR